ncbi:hypothetical protein PAERUG_E15_London_28_01_14_07764 [Pseudomonas aeruginosa]|nr:hypothetical protein PAERUG_E15_London_28_01_14_07764 [Pseudomonas aeruginosa]
MCRTPDCQRAQVQPLQHIQVQQVEEHRRSADIGQRLQCPRQRRPFVQPQQQHSHPQGQQQELQGRRVFGDIEDAQPRAQRSGLVRPGSIPILVGEPQQCEQGQRADACPQQPALALLRRALAGEPGPHQITQCDHPDPRQHRIGGTQAQRASLDPAALMQHFPQHRQQAIALHPHAVEQVVRGHHRDCQHQQGRAWQPKQPGQRDHAQPDGPDHLQVQCVRRQLEGPGEVHQGQLQYHQEQAALEQERGRGPARIRLALAVQPGRQAGQEDEHGCAQVGQQAAGEQRRRDCRCIHRVAHLVLQEEGLAHVVQQHQQHHGAAQLVDGGQARGGGRGHAMQ